MTSSPGNRELNAFLGYMDNILERRETLRELGIPNFLGALQLFTLEERELLGTLLRSGFLDRLVTQNARYEVLGKLQKPSKMITLIRSMMKKIFELPPEKKYQLPQKLDEAPVSYSEEAQWLVSNIDQSSPTQCFMLSDILSANGENPTPLAEEWYRKGLQAARKLSEDNPRMKISIME